MFSDIKKPPVRNSKEADAVVAFRPHFPMGYHLAQLQVGGTSVLSNAIIIISKRAKKFNLNEQSDHLRKDGTYSEKRGALISWTKFGPLKYNYPQYLTARDNQKSLML